MTKLNMQIFCLNETFRMISHALHVLSNNVNFVEFGFEWLWRETTFLGILARIYLTKSRGVYHTIFLKWCNLVRFVLYLDQIWFLKLKKLTIFYIYFFKNTIFLYRK